MYKTILKAVILLIAVGASMGLKAEDWVNYKSEEAKFSVDLPHFPTKMSFEIPMENTNQLAMLTAFSVPERDELFMVCSLALPKTEHEKALENFQNVLYTYILKRMFFQPRMFKTAECAQRPAEYDGKEALDFIIDYVDHQAKHRLSGLAIKGQDRLYILMYFCVTNEFNEKEFEIFKNSFKTN